MTVGSAKDPVPTPPVRLPSSSHNTPSGMKPQPPQALELSGTLFRGHEEHRHLRLHLLRLPRQLRTINERHGLLWLRLGNDLEVRSLTLETHSHPYRAL